MHSFIAQIPIFLLLFCAIRQIIVLQGQVTLVLDKDDVYLKPFDVVVQRGTNHGW